MKNYSGYLLPVIFAVTVITVLGIYFYSGSQKTVPKQAREQVTEQNNNPITQKAMKITSPAFNDGDMIPEKYTCDGENVSPPFMISEVPESAKSLVLIVDDPDAPAGDWVHWLVWNIKPDTGEIGEKSTPIDAVQGTTDFGRQGWGGPCPPSGVHHYRFKLYALDSMLELPASAKKADLEKAMGPHTLDTASMVGLYRKK